MEGMWASKINVLALCISFEINLKRLLIDSRSIALSKSQAELTLLHSKAAAECSSRWRKQWLHLLLLKMFGENLRQSAVRPFPFWAELPDPIPVVVGVGGADTEAATVVVVVNFDILRLVQTKTKNVGGWGPCGGWCPRGPRRQRDREIVRRGGFRRSKIAWQEDLKLL